MNRPDFKKRKIAVRISIFLLAVAFWMLGNVKRNYRIENSPDGRFSINLVAHRGWRSTNLENKFLLYVTDNQTGEIVLAATQPEYCVYEQTALNDVKWKNHDHNFICWWAIEYNGIHQQNFSVETMPLRIKAGAPCCG